MPRHRKEPHLFRRNSRYDKNGRLTHRATWIIKDGDQQTPTGCGLVDLERAKQFLHEYCVKKYAEKPPKAGLEEDSVYIADLIRHYLEANASWLEGKKADKRRDIINQFKRLNEFWGGMTVDKINKLTSTQYQAGRNPNSVRGELEMLRAVVNFGAAEGKVKLALKHNYAIPPKPQARIHFLSLAEAIALYKAARRRCHSFKGRKTHRITTHIARFIVVALMTGTRSERISAASFEREPGRPWIDLENGIYYRRAGQEFVPLNKRADPIQIPDRLLRLLRIWYRDDKARGVEGCQYLIHYHGRSVDCRKGFYSLKNDVLSKERARQINRHTLKHTCVTWLLAEGASVEEVASYVSTTPEIIRKVYGHLIPGQHGVVNAVFSKRRVGLPRTPLSPNERPLPPVDRGKSTPAPQPGATV